MTDRDPRVHLATLVHPAHTDEPDEIDETSLPRAHTKAECIRTVLQGIQVLAIVAIVARTFGVF
jgi:hypothetical protein